MSNILKIYGISQNPDTKEYIMVLEYVDGENFNNYWIKKNYRCFRWDRKRQILSNIVKGLKEIHQRRLIHCDFHTGNILFGALVTIQGIDGGAALRLGCRVMGAKKSFQKLFRCCVYARCPVATTRRFVE